MNRLGLLSAIFVLVACQSDQTGPSQRITIPSRAVSDEGPPSQYPFAADTYRPGQFTGAPIPPLTCQPAVTTGATYDGFLVTADGTSLDARLQVPAGTGPFPLVTLIHGYAGSKGSSGDIAAKLLGDGYAVLRYSTRGFGDSWGQVNLADLNLEIADLRTMVGRVMDDPNCNLDPQKVAVTGASYGGGHSWLALVQPTFPTPSGTKTVQIVAVAPIAPWTDLFYSLLPNGRPNASIDGFGGLLSRTKGQADRVAHVIMDEVLHRSFKRCREAQSLTGLGQPRNNPADSGNKSHVEHAVHFVKHKSYDTSKRNEFSIEQVFESARSGDDQLCPGAHRLQLSAFRDATDKQRRSGKFFAAQLIVLSADLLGQLTRGRKNQCSGPGVRLAQ